MKKNKLWLFHPDLVNKERGFTGRYKPAGIDKLTGEPLIELEQIFKKDQFMKFEDSPISG